jgi:cytochrome c553
MKKLMFVLIAMLVIVGVAMAQNPSYASGSGIQGIDKLGAHQNGGRGCVGCHAPHSGARGNGGTLTWKSAIDGTTKKWTNQTTVTGNSGEDALWGQDLGPVLGLGTIKTGNGYTVDLANAETTQPRVLTGIVMCLSCHDGNVAKGAMMTNQSFEQAAGLLPATYGSQAIPTLLADDGGAGGNYTNDHPIGQAANVGALPIATYVDLDSASAPTKLILKTTQPDAKFTTFQTNYGLPVVVGARAGAGFAVETTMTSASQAYVVCTTCHTPHSMYTATASGSNKIAGLSAGTFPSYFFIAAPYNPGANVAGGTKASSATQFCRQCHFTGAGGSNEGSGISIPTAF